MLGDDVLPQPYRFVNKVVQQCVERALEEITFHMSRSPVLDRKYIPPKLTKKLSQQTLGVVFSPDVLERPPTVSGLSVYPPELGASAVESQKIYDQGQIQKKRTARIRQADSNATSPVSTPLPPDATLNLTTGSNDGDSIPATLIPKVVVTSSTVDAPRSVFGLSDGSVQIVDAETQTLIMRTPVFFESITHDFVFPDLNAIASAIQTVCTGNYVSDQDAARCASSASQQPPTSKGGQRGSRGGSRRDTTPIGRRDSVASVTSPSTCLNPYLPPSNPTNQPPAPGVGIVSVAGGTPLHPHGLDLYAAATAVDGIVVFAVDFDGLSEGPKLEKTASLTVGSNQQQSGSPCGIREVEIRSIRDTLIEDLNRKAPTSPETKQQRKNNSTVSVASRPPITAAPPTPSSGIPRPVQPKKSGTSSTSLRDAAPPIELGVVTRIPHQMLSSAVSSFYERHPEQNPVLCYNKALQRTKPQTSGLQNVVNSPPVTSAPTGRLNSEAPNATPRRLKSANSASPINVSGGNLSVSNNKGSTPQASPLDINVAIPDSMDTSTDTALRPLPPPPAEPGSFVSSIKLSQDGSFIAIGMDNDATVVVVEIFTTCMGDDFSRVPHVIEVISSPSRLFEAVGDLMTPKALYHFGILPTPLSSPAHQPQPNPVLEYLRKEVKAVKASQLADAEGTQSSHLPANSPASAPTPRNPSATTERDKQSRLKQIQEECSAAALLFAPNPTSCGWIFIGWAGTNSMTRISLKNSASLVRAVVFSSVDTVMKSTQNVTSDVCLSLVAEEVSKAFSASKTDAHTQIHSKLNSQLNRAALGPNGTGSLAGPTGISQQDLQGGNTSKKGGNSGIEKPPKSRAVPSAGATGFFGGESCVGGPFPVSGESSAASFATISVAHAVASSMGILPSVGSSLLHPVSGALFSAQPPSTVRCGSSGNAASGNYPPPTPKKDQRLASGSNITLPQNSRSDLLLPATLIVSAASRDSSLIALCCINGVTAVYDTVSLNFKHYFNEMPHRITNNCQKLVAPKQAIFQGNRTLTVSSVTFGASYRSFVCVYALQPGLVFPPAEESRTVQERKKQSSGKSLASQLSAKADNAPTIPSRPSLLTLDSPTRVRNRHLPTDRLSQTLSPTTENYYGSLTPAASCCERLCKIPYLDALEFALPLGEHLPLLLVKACGHLMVIDMTEGELVCVLSNESRPTTAPLEEINFSGETSGDSRSSIERAVSQACCSKSWSPQAIEHEIHRFLRQVPTCNGVLASIPYPSHALLVSTSASGGDGGFVLLPHRMPTFPTQAGSSAVYPEPITRSLVGQKSHLSHQVASALIGRCTPPSCLCLHQFRGLPILFSEYPQVKKIIGGKASAKELGPLLFVIQHSKRTTLSTEQIENTKETLLHFQTQFHPGSFPQPLIADSTANLRSLAVPSLPKKSPRQTKLPTNSTPTKPVWADHSTPKTHKKPDGKLAQQETYPAEVSFKQATLDSLEARERGRIARGVQFDAIWDRLSNSLSEKGFKELSQKH